MQNNIILLNKPRGLSPLQAIEKLRKQYSQYATEKLGYAGRLDPMAEGLLVILCAEENMKRKTYENLPKTYEFSVLFGVSTDTYDILGKISSSQKVANERLKQKVQILLPTYIGKQRQPYPPYSSKPVNGKPLFYWARENKLHTIRIPSKVIEIYDLVFLSVTTIPATILAKTIRNRISLVSGKFRQEEILQKWQEFFIQNKQQSFPVMTFRVTCSSGTYVRSLAVQLGKELAVPSLAYSIKRTHVGELSLTDAITLI